MSPLECLVLPDDFLSHKRIHHSNREIRKMEYTFFPLYISILIKKKNQFVSYVQFSLKNFADGYCKMDTADEYFADYWLISKIQLLLIHFKIIYLHFWTIKYVNHLGIICMNLLLIPWMNKMFVLWKNFSAYIICYRRVQLVLVCFLALQEW